MFLNSHSFLILLNINPLSQLPFWLGPHEHFLDDQGFNIRVGDLLVQLGFGTRVVEGGGFGVDHEVHPPVLEVAGYLAEVELVELAETVVELGLGVAFDKREAGFVELDGLGVQGVGGVSF